MLRIRKLSEPRELAEFRCGNRDPRYADLPREVREALKRRLMREQSALCAYCMGRIYEASLKIEHVKSQREYPHLQLQYSNLVACCPGKEGENKHCDTSKGSMSLSRTPSSTQYDIEDYVDYDFNTGEIMSKDPEFERELNEVLNLNFERLMTNRRGVLRGVQNILNASRGVARLGRIRKALSDWRRQDKEGRLKPYSGIVIAYLRKSMAE